MKKELVCQAKILPLITDSNQACMVKMVGRRVLEETDGSPLHECSTTNECPELKNSSQFWNPYSRMENYTRGHDANNPPAIREYSAYRSTGLIQTH